MILLLRPRSRSQSGQRSKWCLSNNSKSTRANFTKLHRKIEHNKKVCRTQTLGSAPKVTVTIGLEVKMCLISCCSYTTESNLIKLHRKIKHNEKVCRAHDFGQGRNQVRGQNRVSAITQKLLEQI